MKYCVCTMGDGMRTILQVNKCSGVLRQILFGKGLSESKKSLDFGFFCDVNQNQAPVVQKLDSAIHQINRYPKDDYYEN